MKYKKSDLNSGMLFKLRNKNQGLCVLLDGELFNKKDLFNGGLGGRIDLDDYNDDLSLDLNEDFDWEYEIVAIKQYKSCSEALSMVLNDQEPNEWDWVEEEEEEEEKVKELNSVPTTYNMTFNITIDHKIDINEFMKELSDEISKKMISRN